MLFFSRIISQNRINSNILEGTYSIRIIAKFPSYSLYYSLYFNLIVSDYISETWDCESITIWRGVHSGTSLRQQVENRSQTHGRGSLFLNNYVSQRELKLESLFQNKSMADFISNSSFQACSKSHNRWFLQDIVDTLILYHFGVKNWKKTLLCFTEIFLIIG